MVMWQTLRKCKLDHDCAQVGCVPKGTQDSSESRGFGLVRSWAGMWHCQLLASEKMADFSFKGPGAEWDQVAHLPSSLQPWLLFRGWVPSAASVICGSGRGPTSSLWSSQHRPLSLSSPSSAFGVPLLCLPMTSVPLHRLLSCLNPCLFSQPPQSAPSSHWLPFGLPQLWAGHIEL